MPKDVTAFSKYQGEEPTNDPKWFEKKHCTQGYDTQGTMVTRAGDVPCGVLFCKSD